MKNLLEKFMLNFFSLNALNAVFTTMLKYFRLNSKILVQIAKTFLGMKSFRIKSSFRIGSSRQVDSCFYNTAGWFPLKVWKKHKNEWFQRKWRCSIFFWTSTRQFINPTRKCLAQLPNAFRSKSKKIVKV